MKKKTNKKQCLLVLIAVLAAILATTQQLGDLIPKDWIIYALLLTTFLSALLPKLRELIPDEPEPPTPVPNPWPGPPGPPQPLR